MNYTADAQRDEARNLAAREAAQQASTEVFLEPTSLVSYRSSGRLLIIGDYDQALTHARTLPATLHYCILATTSGTAQDESIPVLFSPREHIQLSGHFGAFAVTVKTDKDEINIAKAITGDAEEFDLILDLGKPPLLTMEIPPLGYYAPNGDQEKLSAALAELPEMRGEFEKAKFFSYNPDICAHGNSGLQACRRCLDACPTDAIISLGEKIAVDPYYCQGGGSCATACPSGAIIYSYPQPADAINRLRVLLRTYREAGGLNPLLLFHDSEVGGAFIAGLGSPLPGNIIPVEVEDIGSVGMDIWLSTLAYGARRVLLLTPSTVPGKTRRELEQQLDYARLILQAMGYPGAALSCIDASETALLDVAETEYGMPPLKPAGFAGSNEKRTVLFSAIDWLHAQATQSQTETALPAYAPFGEIRVDRAACTLCMACVSVCPAAALSDGGDTPRLDFIEANCVQCGLCEKACPEDAVTLNPRFNFEREQRHRRLVLNEEQPFYCISCGAPFATRSVIEKMTAKLQGHPMFQEGAALKRLQMCGECRVRDMLGSDSSVLK